MKYTVSINEKKRIVTVNLGGYVGEARCCPTDSFNISTGIELALERAKVAKKNAEAKQNEEKPTKKATDMTITMLAEQLEKVLPRGSMVVAVGGGDDCLTDEGKKWLAKLAGVSCNCGCDVDCECCHDAYEEGYEEGRKKGYEEGYNEGRENALCEVEIDKEGLYEELMDNIGDTIRDILD